MIKLNCSLSKFKLILKLNFEFESDICFRIEQKYNAEISIK